MAKLYYRYGAMNSGKTTALLQVAFNYNERGMRVLILYCKKSQMIGIFVPMLCRRIFFAFFLIFILSTPE